MKSGHGLSSQTGWGRLVGAAAVLVSDFSCLSNSVCAFLRIHTLLLVTLELLVGGMIKVGKQRSLWVQVAHPRFCLSQPRNLSWASRRNLGTRGEVMKESFSKHV